MSRIGITGHMDLMPATVGLVRTALSQALTNLASSQPITGVSCLAAGADSIFAEEILSMGAALVAVLPAQDYRQRKVTEQHAPTFDRLLQHCDTVEVMHYARSGREAYQAANERLIHLADVLLAVWDGQEGLDTGGTSALVQRARSLGREVHLIWPTGAQREPRP
jgi:hypothetical protein